MKKFTFKLVQEGGVRLLWNIIIFVGTPVEYTYTSYTISSVGNTTYCFIYTMPDYARVASSALNHPETECRKYAAFNSFNFTKNSPVHAPPTHDNTALFAYYYYYYYCPFGMRIRRMVNGNNNKAGPVFR